MSSTLLQDVLRPYGIDHLNRKLAQASVNASSNADDDRDSEDEIIGVQSLPGTPSRSRAPSRPSSRPSSRAASPTKGAFKRPVPGPLHLTTTKPNSTDPLRIFPTELSQRIFGLLSVADLARCSRTCKKWNKSQTLNYVWFQQYRKETFRDDKLPPGKWTKRESKQNWRQEYVRTIEAREAELAHTPFSRSSTPSGYQTPRELREEQWKIENDTSARPNKLEMREMYKELGGRKSRTKPKFGSTIFATRDKGGWQFTDEYL